MRGLFAAGVALALGPTGDAQAQSPRTVSDYFLSLEATAGRLDLQVADRQKSGDMAAAQRLVLAAAMVRRAAAEFRAAEQAALLETVASLPDPIPRRADAALALAAEAEAKAAAEASYVGRAHQGFNALIAALPQKTPHPVFYGLLSGDLAPLDADIVIYGFRLIDPLSKTIPTVLQGKTELPASQVKLAEDRIEVTLPESVRQAVRFAPPPCEPRKSFALRVRATYLEPHGVWPISWTSEIQTGADLYALPTPVIYDATIAASAETSKPKMQTIGFRRKSGLFVADCGESRAAQLSVALPEGAHEATCTATWVDVSGAARLGTRCAVEAQAAQAAGEIVAGATVCSPENLCSCLSKAQGFLEASGSYRVEQPAHQFVALPVPGPATFSAGGVGRTTLELPLGDRVRHIGVTIARRACPTPLDSLDLTPTDAADAEAAAVSKTGAFRAILRGTELSVGAAEALAPGAARAP